MIESAVLRELRTTLGKKDEEKTGVLPWEVVQETFVRSNVVLGADSQILAKQYFSSEDGVRYQELLRNLHTSLTDGIRTWRVYKPAYTTESRNLRESEANTMVRKVSVTPPPPAAPVVSVINQLQNDRVDYLSLGLARETFQRLDRDMTGRLSPSVFEQCFRSRHISPLSRRLIMEQSKDAAGQVEFARFNQLIENYKYAPLKNRRALRRRDTEESVQPYSDSKGDDAPPSKRVASNLQKISAKLKEKFSSSLRAFRAFRKGEGLGMEQFTTEIANLGMNFSPEETKELFVCLAQGQTHLSFDLFNSCFEATPPPSSRPLPQLSLTPDIPLTSSKHAHAPTPPSLAYGFPSSQKAHISPYSYITRIGVSPLRRRVHVRKLNM